MVRKKSISKHSSDPRSAAFHRRKLELMQKALEFSILFESEVAVIVFNSKGQLFEFSNITPHEMLKKYQSAFHTPHECLSTEDFQDQEEDEPCSPSQLPAKKKRKRGKPGRPQDDCSDWEPEDDEILPPLDHPTDRQSATPTPVIVEPQHSPPIVFQPAERPPTQPIGNLGRRRSSTSLPRSDPSPVPLPPPQPPTTFPIPVGGIPTSLFQTALPPFARPNISLSEFATLLFGPPPPPPPPEAPTQFHLLEQDLSQFPFSQQTVVFSSVFDAQPGAHKSVSDVQAEIDKTVRELGRNRGGHEPGGVVFPTMKLELIPSSSHPSDDGEFI